MDIPAKMQKLERPGNVEREPKKKAIPSVIEVIVMLGPAWARPNLNLSFASRCYGVWSIQLVMTNMSSTPSPRSIKGRIPCALEKTWPNSKARA